MNVRDLRMGHNMMQLKSTSYPGRGLIVGLDDTGQFATQVYWIMGRSPNSQNRVFVRNGNILSTEAADPEKVEDPSLIIYNAMRGDSYAGGCEHIVSNGNQTDTVMDNIDLSLSETLKGRQYEPDEPNFTPRITGRTCITPVGQVFHWLSILKKDEGVCGDGCVRFTYDCGQIKRGYGLGLTTYSGNGNPLPPFCQDPLVLDLSGKPGEILRRFWDLLNPDYRISIAVKTIDIVSNKVEIRILNRFKKV